MTAAFETPRLRLRRWRAADRAPFAALNADPAVMQYFPAPLTRAQSDALVDRIEAGFERLGFGLWAVETRAEAEFIGFVGLMQPTFEAAFTPCTEIGWRLAAAHWGRGYATEAAGAVLPLAFGRYGLDAVHSFTTEANAPSRRVMEKLGLRRVPALDFSHPRTPGWAGHWHVVYRITAEEYGPAGAGTARHG